MPVFVSSPVPWIGEGKRKQRVKEKYRDEESPELRPKIMGEVEASTSLQKRKKEKKGGICHVSEGLGPALQLGLLLQYYSIKVASVIQYQFLVGNLFL